MQSNLTIQKLEQLAPALIKISERMKGCGRMIESLASCENLHLGFRGMDIYAAKGISRRLYSYADCWRVVAEHITTPDLPIAETNLEDDEKSRALSWLSRGNPQPLEVGYLFDVYAEYLPPCLWVFEAVGHNYDDAPRETEEARTSEAIFFVNEELRTLSNDADSLSQEVQSAWNALAEQQRAA